MILSRASALVLAVSLLLLASVASAQDVPPPKINSRPNILWLSLEDISPDWGCYGDAYAVTPVFDRFAKNSVRYTRVFTHAPVCAPSRSGIITGMYPTTIGTHHMRCKGVTPPEVKCFTEYLRAAGYYCTNNAKTDYQFDPPFTAWDENGNRAHWRGRQPGQPFFAVFNFMDTHESQVRDRSPQTKSLVEQLTAVERHDPAKAILPPYYPDTPIVRSDWANYHDNITAVQKRVAQVLEQLDKDGLADDTIVWIWGDHGRGLPRGKRWVYDSGIQVPLLVRVPEKWRNYAGRGRAEQLRAGSVNDDLVAFVDFAPTVLSLAGVKIPKHMQGQPFLGPKKAPPRDHVFAARDRMDERYDMIRAVRDKRYKYIRNFMPHLPYAQRIAYMDLMPTMQEWRRLHAENHLDGPQALFFRETKPVEELYDTEADPDEIHNLADDLRHAAKLKEMREQLVAWMIETRDLGLIPEPILDEIQRPNAEWCTTAAPALVLSEPAPDGETKLVMLSDTVGASLGYRLKGDANRRWKLTDGVVTVKRGETLIAKACRIGFRDSATVEFTPQSRPSVTGPRDNCIREDSWRRMTDRAGLKELLAIKKHDHDPAGGIDEYRRALNGNHPAKRYWAIIGLRIAVGKQAPSEADKTALIKLAESDYFTTVRIAAAHTLCRWGGSDRGMPVLSACLDDPQPSVQLYAAHALEDIGEQARPLLPKLKQLAAKSSEYVERVASHAVEQLSERNR